MKNTFLEAVSHDLRTPLTSILGSAVTLEQAGLDLPREDAVDLLQRIASNARKLERLLSDLLDLDRLQRGIITPQRRRTDVGALVREAVQEFEQLGGREVLFDSPPLPADVDPPKVERIVENLLSNASRHTPSDRTGLGARRTHGRRHPADRRGRGRRRPRRPQGRRSSSRSARRRALRPPRRVWASGSRSSRVSPSCTAAVRGSRTAPAAAPRSRSCSPSPDERQLGQSASPLSASTMQAPTSTASNADAGTLFS